MWNKEQLEAINTVEGGVQVISCSGSGKSSTLKARVEHMVNDLDIEESDILVISFTNDTAKELKEDLEARLLFDVTVGTFHSVCKAVLEDAGYKDLLNQPNKYKLKRHMEQATGIKNVNVDNVLSFICYQQSFLIGVEDKYKYYECNLDTQEIRACWRAYEDFKQRTGTYDFDDWLLMTLKGYEDVSIKKTWKYLLLDEAQDSSLAQHRLVRAWCPSNNIFVVGDKMQSLYSWRGAVPELFANFYKEIPNTKVINMNTNYRSSANIVAKANDFIRPYGDTYEYYKDAIADDTEDGHIETHVFHESTEEADAVVRRIKALVTEGADLNKMTILYRNNAMADVVESVLKQEGIEYTLMNSKSFFDKKEIRGILALLRLVAHVEDDEAFEICLGEFRCYPFTYFKKDLIEELLAEAGKRDYSLFEAFMDHRFEKDWQGRNRDYFVDAINRFKLQNERHLPTEKIIENMLKVFKIPNMIYENYDSNMWDDKLDSIHNLQSIAKGQMLGTFLESVMKKKPKKKKNASGVILRSIHSSKGLESEYVFLIGLQDGKFPSDKGDFAEECNIMYVAVTRAKKWQWVSSIGESQFYMEYKGQNTAERTESDEN